MVSKKKGNGAQAPLVQQTEEASVSYGPTQEQIRLRAYQLYLERGGHHGQELDDWLRAERELQKVALFTQGWNRLEQRRERGSEDGK
jgi:Protein of unknown function (DUF2934)